MTALRVLDVTFEDGPPPPEGTRLRVLDVTFEGPEAPKALSAVVIDGVSVRDADAPQHIELTAPLNESISVRDTAGRSVTTDSKHVDIVIPDGVVVRDLAGGSPYQITLLNTEDVTLSDVVSILLEVGETGYCTVRCRWIDALGNGLRGAVEFVPEVPFVGTAGAIVEAPVTVLLSRDGSVTVLLPKPGEPALYPNGVNWRCIPPHPVSPISFNVNKATNLITLGTT